jgi:hypothetical protein
MPEVHAVLVEGVRGHPTRDGHVGILHFQRRRPDAEGSRELNVAVPAPLLPYVAAAALEIITQPESAGRGAHPAVIAARSVQVGLAPDGAMVLTLEMEMGARLGFSVDGAQAANLQHAVSIAVGRQKAQALRATAAARPPRKP